MQRAKRWLYVLLVSVVTSFLIGLFSVMLIETVGPNEADEGRVIERVKGERDVTRCSPGSSSSRCRTTTYPTYSVLGERSDGTTWIAVGEGAFDAMQGERGVIQVTSSTVTGRVVGLQGNDLRDSTWTVGGSGMVLFSIGAVVIWIPLLVAYEWRRRTGFFDLGQFESKDVLIALVGMAVGAVGLWFVLFSKTAGLDVASSADLYGDFLNDPLEFVAGANDDGDEPGVQVGEFVDAGRDNAYATVPLTDLNDEYLSAVDDGVVAIPVLRVADGGPGRFDQATWQLVAIDDQPVDDRAAADGVVIDASPCPPAVRSFPETLGIDDRITGGFVCFDTGSGGDSAGADDVLQLVAGTGVYADRVNLGFEALPTG